MTRRCLSIRKKVGRLTSDELFAELVSCLFVDRSARNATNKTARPNVEENISADDGVSTCSNVSDATSNYDDVEGKAIQSALS